MSQAGEKERWGRLVKVFSLTQDEERRIHDHLQNQYSVEKTDFTYEELKDAASEVVTRIR